MTREGHDLGPYCKFCDTRCFVPLPNDTPLAARAAYGSSTIVATCAAGQQFELMKTGWNYSRIEAEIAAGGGSR